MTQHGPNTDPKWPNIGLKMVSKTQLSEKVNFLLVLFFLPQKPPYGKINLKRAELST